MKKIVILKAQKNLSEHSENDTLLKIDIKAFAIDDKEKITIHRDTTFIYPSPASVKSYLSK
jgi:inorganic pyrophosphatase/exopolyphosphatase